MKSWQSHELFLSRMQDAFEAVDNGWKDSVCTGFLTLPEQQLLVQCAPGHLQIVLWGGYEQAERKMACISLDGQRPQPACLEAGYDERYVHLRHPDLLGALMASGIEREQTGDILVRDGRIVLFCTPEMQDYISMNVLSAGRASLHFEPSGGKDLPAADREILHVSAPSLRADAVVAALAKISRKKAADLIRAGLVKVNDVVLEENTNLCDNDFVSIRRCGRFRFLGIEKTTRKDRLVLAFEKYM